MPMDMRKLFDQAQQMQQQLMQELERAEVEANSGGGLVRVRMNGKKELLALVIEPEALTGNDREMLQDLILAAVNQASRKVDELLSSKMGGLAGRMGLSGLLGG
jgi:DNA-binding YbaB/EbfC family protein